MLDSIATARACLDMISANVVMLLVSPLSVCSLSSPVNIVLQICLWPFTW